ncbi:MAG: TolC family protein [Sedimentisphaerales bacterium]|nr:TolC family protein [Sedimentisphaerales bacterium]
MVCRFRFVPILIWIICVTVVLGCIGGCSTDHYKAGADKEVYQIIAGKWHKGFGSKSNYIITDSNVPSSPNDIKIETAIPASGVLSLARAVAIATAQNRDYQRQKEDLYLTALDLTLARHQFARQWFGTVDASYTRDAADEQVGYGAETGFNQLLADGAQIGASIAIDWARFLTGDPDMSLASVLSANITQPLLRGRGRKIARENLTQAERNALYQIRSFNRYRKTFVVLVVDAYYRVLQYKDRVTNAENNYNSRVLSRERLEMEAEAGRKPNYEVDQARQSELGARDSYLQALQSYEQQLDEFKIMLSLPTRTEIELDQNELKALETVGVVKPDYDLDAAIKTALAHRLDLANSADTVEDMERKVVVAADNLGVELNLIGSAGVNSAPKTKLERLQFQNGTYSIGLEADLPLDRKAERNAYREALIALEQRRREFQGDVDEVELDVRQAYRQLVEAAERYETQKTSLEVAKTRVESTTFLLQAGRVTTRDLLESQDALLSAQNDVTAVLVDYAIAKLSFFRDVGILQVRPDGMWEHSYPVKKTDVGEPSVESESQSEPISNS